MERNSVSINEVTAAHADQHHKSSATVIEKNGRDAFACIYITLFETCGCHTLQIQRLKLSLVQITNLAALAMS